MPTYQYRCKQCGEEFEKMQSFSDDSTPKCPSCGTRSKKNVTKVFSGVGISFKGSGFYKNDSRPSGSSGSKSNSGSSSKSESASKSDSTSSSKSDSGSKKSDSKSKSDSKGSSSKKSKS